jgi:hypothetical protein
MAKKQKKKLDEAREAALSELFGTPEDRAEEFAANLQGELET